jgi:mannose-6-phosphate isomerase class I
MNKDKERIYITPSEEFRLSRITLEHGHRYLSAQKRSVEIILCIEGEGHITEIYGKELLAIHKGMSLLIPAAIPQYRIEGQVDLFKAAVPLP